MNNDECRDNANTWRLDKFIVIVFVFVTLCASQLFAPKSFVCFWKNSINYLSEENVRNVCQFKTHRRFGCQVLSGHCCEVSKVLRVVAIFL